MTSQQILKADFLEIIFENRNKEYGAYILRKIYPTHLWLALAGSITLFFLILLLFKPEYLPAASMTSANEEIIVSSVQLPAEVINKPKPPDPLQKFHTATIPHSTIVFTPDETTLVDVPGTDLLADVGIKNHIGHGINEAIPLHMNDSEAGNEKELPVEKFQAKFDPIETEPQFPGGQQAWLSFLNRFLRVPEDMESGCSQNRLVKFIVGIDGSIDGFEIVQ